MLFSSHLIAVRGGGDLATAVIYRLHKAGFPVIVLELERPLPVRRRVAVASAILENKITIEDLHAQRANSIDEAKQIMRQGIIPVMIAPMLSDIHLQSLIPNPQPPIIIDARMAKRNIDTHMDQAELVIALGPGFTAGVDCHVVIETMRGHRLGRVIWEGSALPNTGTPGIVAGKGAERVLRAPTDGMVNWRMEIGDSVKHNTIIGDVNGSHVFAPFDGVIRGLIAPGMQVKNGLKIGDVDARGNRDACFTISDKALAIAGGVLEAILTHLNKTQSNINLP
ncbi:MAG: EF2563 family selenium-dependent molybdenum hydroxylase system protein [Chloroflexi bacterium]|nr:MAG: EF2563 family selenium-dependent molybdenum hydroxylase system protein [Chloroflexota bacterium]